MRGDDSKSEARFATEVVKYFREKLTHRRFYPFISVATAVKILKDLTIGKDREGCWRLVAGFQQQDVVFFCYDHCVSMSDFRSKFLRIDKYDRRGMKPVIIPLVVCELKIGSNTNTHALITYGSISAQLKSIFPHCAYYFIMDSNRNRGMKPETILRHSKSFDRVFPDWDKEKEIAWQTIDAHLKQLAEFGILSTSRVAAAGSQ